jgi:glycosyltransferase involved in cell wall biosynthesis
MEGYRHRRVALSGTRSRLQGVPSVLARRREIRRLAREVDLVHVHGDMAAMIAAPGLRDRPLVFTTHGLHRLRRSTGVAGRLVRRRLRAAVAATSGTICIACDERDDLAAALPRSLHGRLVVVANGVPVPDPVDAGRRARARGALSLADDEVGVLFVGQLEERKDPLGAIDAVEAARREGAELVLLIAGGGPLEQKVAARAGAGVRPLGHREDLADLYAAADLFLLPSHREGMSFALLEAMAYGLAPVVADGTGNAETVGEAGVVFPAGDLRAMSARLVGLAADPEARARLGAAARARIGTDLSLERFLAGTRAQYEAALAAQRA